MESVLQVTTIGGRGMVPECQTASIWQATIITIHSVKSAIDPGIEMFNMMDFVKTVSSFFVMIA